MAVSGAAVHQNGNGVAFSGPPRHAPAMYSIPIEQPVVTLDAKSAFQVSNNFSNIEVCTVMIIHFFKLKYIMIDNLK